MFQIKAYSLYWAVATRVFLKLSGLRKSTNAAQKEAIRQTGFKVTAEVKAPIPALSQPEAETITRMLKKAGLYRKIK